MTARIEVTPCLIQFHLHENSTAATEPAGHSKQDMCLEHLTSHIEEIPCLEVRRFILGLIADGRVEPLVAAVFDSSSYGKHLIKGFR
ncbi:hypothetical protein V6N13_109232 [Hibiscus sabdariffa]|uniref:Uncharacterized protein n=1 Tax=Hibiscus sabdariffa TaxID=183260 RepID=A0ABR2FNZ3_9ROSI